MRAMVSAESNNGEQPAAVRTEGAQARHAGTDDDPARILIVAPKWVGDLVMATPAFRALRQRYPNSHIAILTRPQFAPVLAGGDWMNEMIHWPADKGQSKPKRRRSFLGFAAELRDHRFDWAVLMTNSFRSALLARLAGIPRRIGYDRDGRGLLLTDLLLAAKAKGKFVPVPAIRYYNAITRYLGCRKCPSQTKLFTTPEEEAVADAAIQSAGVQPGQPIVVINPAASFGAAKCWLPERFAEVADRLIEETGAAVFVCFGPKETHVAHKLAEHMRNKATLLDKPIMSLGTSKAIIRKSNLLITNDTGPRHFAIAFDTPSITIFGPTDPEWTTGDYELEQILMVDVECGPCMKRRCPLDHECMTRITTDQVFEQARAMLSSGTPSPTK